MAKGRALNVWTEELGASLTEAADAGNTILHVTSVGDFSPNGGTVMLNTHAYSYSNLTSYQRPDGFRVESMNIDPPVVLPGDIGDRVLLEPSAEERWALVRFEDGAGGDAIVARIPHHLAPLFADDGIRSTLQQEALELVLEDGTWVITDIYGRKPKLNSAFSKDIEVIPSDGVAPVASPKPKVSGGIRSLFVEWIPVANPDPVTYDIYVSETDDNQVATSKLVASTASTNIVLYNRPNGLPLVPNVTYYIFVVARDMDGAAAPGGTTSGSPRLATGPDIAAESITADKLLANSITGDKLAAVLGIFGQLQIGQITIDPTNGIVIPITNGGAIRLPADGSQAIIDAILRTKDLLVNGGLTINGITNFINGLLRVSSGVVAPRTAPQVTRAPYPTIQLDMTGLDTTYQIVRSGTKYWGVAHNTGSTQLKACSWDLNGVRLTTVDIPSSIYTYVQDPWSQVTSELIGDGSYWYLAHTVNTGSAHEWPELRVARFDQNFVHVNTSVYAYNGGYNPYSNVHSEPASLVTGWSYTNNAPVYVNATEKDLDTQDYVGVLVCDSSGAVVQKVNMAGPQRPGRGMIGGYGIAGCAHVGDRIYITGNDGYLWVYSSQLGSSYILPGYDFIIAPGSSPHIIWDGTRFYTTASDGKLQKYSTAQGGAYYWKYTYFDSNVAGSGTHETDGSPASQVFNHAKGSWVSVVGSGPSGLGTADDPNAIRFYASSSLNGSYYKQTDPAVGASNVIYETPILNGATIPTTNSFEALGGAGGIKSEADIGGSPVWQLKGDGAGKMGPFSWDRFGKSSWHPKILTQATQYRGPEVATMVRGAGWYRMYTSDYVTVPEGAQTMEFWVDFVSRNNQNADGAFAIQAIFSGAGSTGYIGYTYKHNISDPITTFSRHLKAYVDVSDKVGQTVLIAGDGNCGGGSGDNETVKFGDVGWAFFGMGS